MNSPELTQTGSMNSATNSVPEIVGGGLSPRQLQIEQTGAGSTVKYHGMYVAKDAVAQLAGTLPQRAVVPCFVRGARLRGCLGREIKPHSVLRPLRTPGRPRAGAVARVPFGRCHIHALRATWTSASRFGSVRGERQARVPHVVCACVVSCCQRVLCVFCAFCVFCVFCVLCLCPRPRWLPQAFIVLVLKAVSQPG